MFFVILNHKYLLFYKLITMYHLNMNITFSENSNNDENNDFQRGVISETKPKTKKPSMYSVLLLNDDYTPMEFVIIVLTKIFNKKQEEATQIMLHVHKKGVGVCGIFTYEVAESKCKSVMDMAKKNEHPLQCTMEKS
jgi:ATP-dependent Clp protease adaptor protein ClpS